MADQKITELNALTTPETNDVMPIVDDPVGGAETKKVTWTNIVATLKAYFDAVYDIIDAASDAIAAHLLAFDHTLIHTQDTDTDLGAVDPKNPPIDADKALYRDSTASDVLVTSTWTQVKAFLKTYFDGVYQALGSYLTEILEDDSPQLGGDLDLNNHQIVLKFEPGADVTASGLIITATVDTNAQGIGAPLMLAADGNFDTADADASTTSPAVVLALETGTGSKKVLVHGILRVDAWNWTKGPGKASLIYVSTSVGTLTQTQPTGTDDVIQPVGWALSDDCIYFCPSLIYYTHT